MSADEFDPDAYLAEKRSAAAFDPDAYLAEKRGEAAPKPSRPGMLERAARWAGETAADAVTGANGLVSTLGAPVLAAAGALGSYAVPGTGEGSFGDRWRNEMEGLRSRNTEAQERSPVAHMAGSVAPLAIAPELAAEMPAPFSRVAPAGAGMLPFATRAAAGAADAALYNAAATGAANADRPDVADKAARAALSPANALGAFPSVAMEAAQLSGAAKRAAGSIIRSVGPKVTPTAAAQRLMDEGVPLTLGLMNPDSGFAALEQASSDNPFGMHIEHGIARDALGDVFINKARPPGAAPVVGGSPQERLAATREAFDAAYEPLKGIPVAPERLAGMPQEALKPVEGIPDSVREKAATEIADALTAVGYRPPSSGGHHHGAAAPAETPLLDAYGRPVPPTPKAPEPLPDLTVGDLIAVRSRLRDVRRGAVAKGDTDLKLAMDHGLDTVTGAIESSLPPDQAAQLRATDAQYRRFMTIEDAAAKGGPESNISPRAISSVLPRSYGRAATVEGRAGDLQDLAQAGAATFDQRVKPNGMRGVIVAGIPKPAVVSRVLNLPEIKGALTRQPVQTLARPAQMADLGGRIPFAAYIAQALRGQRSLPQFAPAAAEEDRR